MSHGCCPGYEDLLTAVKALVLANLTSLGAFLWRQYYRPVKYYDHSIKVLESEQGEWYVNYIIERELAKLLSHYTRNGPVTEDNYSEDEAAGEAGPSDAESREVSGSDKEDSDGGDGSDSGGDDGGDGSDSGDDDGGDGGGGDDGDGNGGSKDGDGDGNGDDDNGGDADGAGKEEPGDGGGAGEAANAAGEARRLSVGRQMFADGLPGKAPSKKARQKMAAIVLACAAANYVASHSDEAGPAGSPSESLRT